MLNIAIVGVGYWGSQPRSDNLGQYDDFGKFQLIHRAGDLLIPKIDFVEPLRMEARHFVDYIVRGTSPLTDGVNGRRVVKVLEAAQKSLESVGATVDVAS